MAPVNARPTRRAVGRARSGQDGAAPWIAALAAAVAVVAVAGGAWAISQSGNDDSTGPRSDPGTLPTVTASVPSHGSSSSPTTTETPWSRECAHAARAATRAGYAVFAPSQLPAGWALGTCRFDPGSGWHLEVTTGHATVSVDQRKGAVAPLVADILGQGARPGSAIHAAGTGTWQSWTAAQGMKGLSKPLASTAALLSGTVGVPTLHRLADVLLTYENAPPGENGG